MSSTTKQGAQVAPARRIAFQVLKAVEAGGYASDVLAEESQALESRDAGLAAQIVFGCLRFQAQLDHLIRLFSGRRSTDLDQPLLIALRTGIFQLRYLDRVPAHAAVHETVELVKRVKRPAAGLANAVLRKVHRDPVTWPDDPTELSCPAGLLDRWAKHFGSETARGIARAALEEPCAYIRVPPGRQPAGGLDVEATGLPGCYRVLSRPLAGVRLHDIGSQSIVPLLDLQPGQTYLDVCAAPGNKTLQAVEAPDLLAIACDVSERRIHDIPEVCPRVVLDAQRPLPFSLRFDRILIDAPCSGTGTLARNPEIKWRVQNHDFPRLRDKQVQILGEAILRLAPGGKLVYATCSLEKEENEDVLEIVLASRPQVRLEREVWRIPGRDEGDGFYAAVLG